MENTFLGPFRTSRCTRLAGVGAAVFGFAISMPYTAPAANDSPQPGLRAVPESVHADALAAAKNLARWHMGARIYGPDWGSDPQPLEWDTHPRQPVMDLLDEDIAAATPMPAGETDLVIDLGRFYRIETVGFLNQGVRGTLQLQGSAILHSPGSRRWTDLAGRVRLDEDGLAGANFPLTEVRFLRLRFDVATAGGALSFLFVAGDARISDAGPVLPPAQELYEPADTPMVGFDLATLSAGARVTHVSSGNPADAARLIDDNPESEFRFMLDDGDPIFIIEYSDTFRFDSTSMVMNAGRGTMEIYGLPRLPAYLEAGGDTDFVLLPDEFFETHAPAARYELRQPARRLKLDLGGVEARYMLVRFQGINNPTPSFTVSKVSGIGSIPRAYAQYVVTEVFEFADMPEEPLESNAATPEEAPRLAPASP